MIRTNLDELETQLEETLRMWPQSGAWLAAAVNAVAELRAAREVVEAARKADHAVDLIGTTDYSQQCLWDITNALAAYDQQIQPTKNVETEGKL